MNIVVQHLDTRLYLAKDGSWVKLDARPAKFENAIEAISRCIKHGLRSVRLVSDFDSPGNERFLYPFGEDPVIKAEKKKLRRSLRESRRLKQQKRIAMHHLDVVCAEAKETRKQFPFTRKAIAESSASRES